nr:protein kinase [Hymenolepis microstoma]
MWIFSGKSSNESGGNPNSSVLFSHDDPLSSLTLLPPPVTESLPGPCNFHWVRQSAYSRKTPSDRVTVFSCANASSYASGALSQTVKRMKTLRHPNILTWMGGTETPNPKVPFCIITEEVRPLSDYLREQADACENFAKLASWGIYQIARTLRFLNDDCQLSFNAVCAAAVYVNRSGEWKLGRLDYVTPIAEAKEMRMNIHRPAAYCAPNDHCVDSWGLACLIWEIFNPEPLTEATQLGAKSSLERLPKNLVTSYRRLLSTKTSIVASKTRSPFAAFLKVGFFKNDYIDTLLFLEEIQLKDKEEKAQFLAGLGQRAVGLFPDDICRYKILPHLVQSVQYGSAGVEALVPVLELSHLLPASDFEVVVVPALVRLFAAPDRATRVRLLEQLPKFVSKLPPKLVESQIFPPVAAGFTDANPLVREATIRAMVHLAPKLPSRVLNDALVRHLTTLEFKDDQGGIRTNATICLAKLAVRMEPSVRRGPVLNALLRATRDTFPASRQAAITGLAACQAFFSAQELAGKVIPCLSFVAVDPEKDIRDIALKAMRGMIERLEKTSEDPTVGEADTSVLGGTTSGASAVAGSVVAAGGKLTSAGASIGNWAITALSSLSSRLISSSNTTGGGTASAQQALSQTTTTATVPSSSPGAPNSVPLKPQTLISPTPPKKSSPALKMVDGWEDEEEEDEGFRSHETPKQTPSIAAWGALNADEDLTNDVTGGDGNGDWGEDEDNKLDFDSLSFTTPKTTIPTSSSKPQDPRDDLLIDWDKPISASQPTPPTTARQQDDSWTSWGKDTSPVKPKPKPLEESGNRGSQHLRSSKASSLSPALSGKSSLGSRVNSKASSGGSGAWQRAPATSNVADFFEEMLGSTSSKASSLSSSVRNSPVMRSNPIASSGRKAVVPPVLKKTNEDEGDGWDAW